MDIKTISDIQLLIDNAVEESTELEYKCMFAEDKQIRRCDIAKDVSAMANANGGIIIYGIKEKETTKGHSVPEKITPIQSKKMSKDQLSQIISSTISPRIRDIEITHIPYNEESGLFVVNIPKSSTAHQNLTNHLYHIRRNATIEVMEDYEIRDVMNRQTNPPLSIVECAFYKRKETDLKVEYEFVAKIQNVGFSVCQTYKLNVYINKIYPFYDIDFKSCKGFSYTVLDSNRLKISCNSMEPIFDGEILEVGHFKFLIDKNKENVFCDGLIIDMILFYPGGSDNLAYIPNENKYIEGRENIDILLGIDT